MGKDKLRRFAENLTFECFVQPAFEEAFRRDHPLKGHWHSDFFHNDRPIVLELGCGKGEYTVGLARRFPDRNFIGIDIKGARMWTGACQARDEGMGNVAFIRTSIELLESFFAPGEVSEIWITFPDPQMKKVRKRLTGTRFIELYRRVSCPEGIVNLKTDSPFLYAYTAMMMSHNGIEALEATDDLYATIAPDNPILNIRTHYENQWLDRGLTIKYLKFPLGDMPLSEPPGADDLEHDTYRSYSRGYIQMPDML
mgnify:CR=1 FL=1